MKIIIFPQSKGKTKITRVLPNFINMTCPTAPLQKFKFLGNIISHQGKKKKDSIIALQIREDS